jgi:hypothetical protein
MTTRVMVGASLADCSVNVMVDVLVIGGWSAAPRLAQALRHGPARSGPVDELIRGLPLDDHLSTGASA